MIKRILLFFTIAVATLGVSDLFPKGAPGRYQDQVAVLMYHHVHDQDTSSSTVTTELFRAQLSFLQRQGYHFITLTEFKNFMQGSPVPSGAVLVTFDDGYRSFYEFAYPVLKELGIPAVNFIVTKDLADPLAPSIPALSRDEIGQMLREKPGMYDFQCHSNDLHHKIGSDAALTSRTDDSGEALGDDAYRSKIEADTAACASNVSSLYGAAGTADSYAYPFGVFDPTALKVLSEEGFRYGFTIIAEMATRRSDPMQIPRINAGNPKIRPENLQQMIERRIEAASP